jgi:hypothetical protein
VFVGVSLRDSVGKKEMLFVGPSEGAPEKVSDGNADTDFDGMLLGMYVGALGKVLLGDPETIVGTSDIKFVSSSDGAPDAVSDGEADSNVDGTLLCAFVGLLDGIMLGNPELVGLSEIICVGPLEGNSVTALDGPTDKNSDGT